MNSKKSKQADTKFARWVKDGRGQGRGRDYKPWLTVRDVPSRGRSHRVHGYKAQRTHHLFSDLELSVFLLLEWHPETTDIREQFPLPLDVTRAVAEDAGIRHPAVSGVAQYMTSDFRVSSSDLDCPEFALQAKMQADLSDPRTVEKLELERRYWETQGIPWFLISERDIPAVVTRNIKWLYPVYGDHIPTAEMQDRLAFYVDSFQTKPGRTIVSAAKALDKAYHLEPGDTLLEIRQLLAQRFFLFDIRIPHTKLSVGDLSLAAPLPNQGGFYVSGE